MSLVAVSFEVVLEKYLLLNNLNFCCCYRMDEKTKKYCIPFVKPNKHSPSGICNINLTTSVSELFSVVEKQALVLPRLLVILNMIVKN